MREMKDSGIAWIGEIPSEWKVCKLLNLLRKPITDGPHETPVLQDIGIPFISVDSLNDSENIDFSKVKKFISDDLYEEYSKKTILEENDILFTKAATIGKTAIVKKDKFMVWSPLAILKCNNSISYYRYVYHLMNCQLLIDDVILHGSNNTQINVGMRELEKINTPLPPLAEQQFIASFLDKKCSEIDTLISLQEEMISELQTYKQSVITEAVTKGLNPNVPMKDSGVEWIGEIPAEWTICKIKNIFRLSTGTTPKSFEEIMEDEDMVNWYTPSDINDCGNELWSSQRKLSKRVIENEGIKLYPKHSLIYVGIGATAGKVGYSHVEGYSNQQITALIPKGKENKYYFYLLNAVRIMIRENAYFTTLPIINNSYLGQREVPCPTIEERCKIADYLDEKTAQIDSLISIKQEKIQELKDYKKSIIYEYVTGKKRV